MDMEVFAGKVCTAVEKELSSEFRAEVSEVRKNNGILLHGLLISSKRTDGSAHYLSGTFSGGL